MKRKVFTVMATCCFLALGGAATAHAQLAGTTLRAMIPFDFSVRGKTLPAGEYEIKRITMAPDGLIISGVNNREHEIFDTEPVSRWKAPNRGEIIFHRYGDSYFLSEVFAGGEQAGGPDRRGPRRADVSGGRAKGDAVSADVCEWAVGL